MTNKEAVIATLQITGYSDGAIEKALLDNGLNGADTYVIENSKNVRLVSIEVLQGMLSLSSVSEGGYTVSYSAAGIQKRLDYLNDAKGQPVVRRSNAW